MELLRPAVQHYEWGDTRTIPELIGVPADGRPWAELWWGTHPSATTTTSDGRPLDSLAGDLPYLLKVLTAAEPLSLQTHPTERQAIEGFDREDAAGIALDADSRIYRDRRAKPELLCALSPFEALCGFRPFDETARWFRDQGWDDLAVQLDRGPAHFLRWALTDAPPVLPSAAPSWVHRIAARHPGDGGVLAALLLHHIILEPGDAVFLEAGNLHAYLAGSGVEVMESSDNVVRGGLTSKHVDVEELLGVVDLSPLDDPVLHPVERSAGRWHYPTPGTPFDVWRVEVDDHWHHVADHCELVLCTAGDGGPLPRGQAAYLAPGDAIDTSGPATYFRVTAPG